MTEPAKRSLSAEIAEALRDGLVIPAHPLALDENRRLDERHQRALTRYYAASGAGGIAVGVHSTQFEIRNKGIELHEPVLRMAAEEIERAGLDRPFIKVAGLCGPTAQAVEEAQTAAEIGYDAGLLSMGGLPSWSEKDILKRTAKVAETIPVIGFYLQPSVGGNIFSFDFWREFAEIPNVVAIKMAPFNRYQTIDVVRAVCYSSRRDEIALYTGNDDNIVNDLLTTYRFPVDGAVVEKRIVGGLLGHWAVWTRKAVELLEEVKRYRDAGEIPKEWLARNVQVTDANAAFFDPAHQFAGCIPGIHEVLRRQGLMQGTWCLNPHETLSPGQREEIDRVYRDYPHLNDDDFVSRHLQEWLVADPGYQDYRPGPVHEFTVHTVGHNSMLVNGRGQTARGGGRLDAWFLAKPLSCVTGEAAAGYEGAVRRWERTMLLVSGDYYIVVDDIVPADDRDVIELLFHTKGKVKDEAGCLVETGGDVERFPVAFEGDGASALIYPVGGNPVEAKLLEYPGAESYGRYLSIRPQGDTDSGIWLATVLIPQIRGADGAGRDGHADREQPTVAGGEAGGARWIQVRHGEWTDIVCLASKAGNEFRQSGNVAYCGKLAAVSLLDAAERLTACTLVDGTRLEYGGHPCIVSGHRGSVSVQYGEDEVRVKLDLAEPGIVTIGIPPLSGLARSENWVCSQSEAPWCYDGDAFVVDAPKGEYGISFKHSF